MSKIRKLLKQKQQEQTQLDAPESPIEESDAPEDAESVEETHTNAFAQLALSEDEEDAQESHQSEEETSGESNLQRSKSKGKGGSKSRSRKNKSKNGGSKHGKPPRKDDLDEIEDCSFGEESKVQLQEKPTLGICKSLFGLAAHHFDERTELKRRFGAQTLRMVEREREKEPERRAHERRKFHSVLCKHADLDRNKERGLRMFLKASEEGENYFGFLLSEDFTVSSCLAVIALD